jgi:HD-GYP domain-containing protein (c-di-GMP phosphodiesterase class II)
MSEAANQGVRLTFAQTFLQLLRLSRLYDATNVNLNDPVEGLVECAEAAAEGNKISLQAEGGVIYLNKRPIRGGRKAFNTIQSLVKVLGEQDLAEISFALPIDPDGLREFLNLLRAAESGQALKEALKGVSSLGERFRVFLPGEATGTANIRKVEIDEDTYFPLAYSRTLILLREYVKHLRDEQLSRYFSQKLQRAAQELVTLSARHEHRILALASIRDADEYQFTHMVNTGLLSVCLGRRMGLTNLQLSDLAFAAFLHGIGRFRTAPELLAKPEPLEKADRREVGRHPYRSMAAFLESKQISSRAQIAAVVAFQFDLWRRRTRMRIPVFELHPYTKIVAVCELYDGLITEREGHPALAPDEALEHIRSMQSEKKPDKMDGGSRLGGGLPGSKVLGSTSLDTRRVVRPVSGRHSGTGAGSGALGGGDTFDPCVIQTFSAMLGIFPAGTLVQLSGGEVAVVVHANPEHLRRPLVAVIRDPGGAEVDADYRDLADQDVQGRFRASIVRLLDGEALGIQIPDELSV